MAQQKVVVGVQVGDARKRSTALKLVVGFPGVVSASIEGDAKAQIVVIGEGVDSVVLVSALRKKLGFAELKSVGSVEEKKKVEEKKNPVVTTAHPAWIGVAPPTGWAYQYQLPSRTPQYVYEEPLGHHHYGYYQQEDSSCSVM